MLLLKCTASMAQHLQERGERGLPETPPLSPPPTPPLLLFVLFILKLKTALGWVAVPALGTWRRTVPTTGTNDCKLELGGIVSFVLWNNRGIVAFSV